MIAMPDKDETFEETIAIGDEIGDSAVSADVTAKEVSYNISSDGVLTAKADISAKIYVSGSAKLNALTGITVDSSVKKERDGDYAIKLYFGVPGEDVWSIAKRYSTSVSAIMEENELDGDKLRSGGMLLIPIVT
jgi:LysM repeat protein